MITEVGRHTVTGLVASIRPPQLAFSVIKSSRIRRFPYRSFGPPVEGLRVIPRSLAEPAAPPARDGGVHGHLSMISAQPHAVAALAIDGALFELVRLPVGCL